MRQGQLTWYKRHCLDVNLAFGHWPGTWIFYQAAATDKCNFQISFSYLVVLPRLNCRSSFVHINGSSPRVIHVVTGRSSNFINCKVLQTNFRQVPSVWILSKLPTSNYCTPLVNKTCPLKYFLNQFSIYSYMTKSDVMFNDFCEGGNPTNG